MTTDGEKNDRGKDRTEAAFDALSAPKAAPPEPDTGNPWKPAALLLLLMALALPLAFGIRSSRIRIEYEGRVAEAAQRAAEVQNLAEAGDLPGAVLAMAEVSEALADVDGLPEATRLVRNGVVQKITDLRAEQERVAERDERIDRNRVVVEALLAGDPKDATRRIKDIKRLGALEKGLERLSLRLDALCMASTVEGEQRIAALELLGTAWKLPVVEAERARADAEFRRARAVTGHLILARAALENGDTAAARKSYDLAGQTQGISGIAAAFKQLRVAELKTAGELFASAGSYLRAAACYEMAGSQGLADAAISKAKAEGEADRRKYLIDTLEQRLSATPDPFTRAAVTGVLAELTGDQSRDRESRAHTLNGLLALARTLRAKGDLEGARALADAAKGAEGLPAFSKSLMGELVRQADAERAERADAVLLMGGPAYAAWLVAQNQEQPAGIMRKIGNARLSQAVTESRARFDRGDLSGARDALAGQPADSPEVQELFRRLLLATDEGNFVVELPKDQKAAEALIYRAVLDRFRTDPAAAGKILATYEKSPAGIIPAVAAFLDAADTTEGKAVWQAVKVEVEKRFPKPEVKAPVEPEETEPDEVE